MNDVLTEDGGCIGNAVGTTDGMDLQIQFFVDQKSAGFTLANETKAITAADCVQAFGGDAK